MKVMRAHTERTQQNKERASMVLKEHR